MEDKPNYYAIIPAEVRYDNDLRAGAKIFYGEITALCSKFGYCTASNNYFAELYNMTPGGITHWVTQLKNKGYINVEYEKEGKEIKKRKIYLTPLNTNNLVVDKVLTNVSTVLTKVEGGTYKNIGGYLQKDKENNTSINNTSINNKYIDDNETNDLFLDFLEMRKKKKIPNTERAIKLLINKLNKLSINEQKKTLEESIVKGWTSVYPKESKMPEWADKEQVKEEINESEKKELEEMLKEFKE